MAGREAGGWWKKWLQQSYQEVKEKYTETLEFVKQDLNEFSQMVQRNTACPITVTANVPGKTEGSPGATGNMKGLSAFLRVISDPSPNQTIDCDVITLMDTPVGTTEIYDSAKVHLCGLHSNPVTYSNEPDGPSELFGTWLSQFHLEEKKDEISNLFSSSLSNQALSSKMVPAAVSHSKFWHQYFYRLHHLAQKEAQRDALKQWTEHSVFEEPGWEEEEEVLVISRLNMQSLESLKNLGVVVIPSAEVTPSESSKSVSLVTHVINPAFTPEALALEQTAPGKNLSSKLLEVTLEDQVPIADTLVESTSCGTLVETGPSLVEWSKPSTPTGYPSNSEPKAVIRVEILREKKPKNLGVFELNSDSQKSTLSNNGKKDGS
ncbi:LOW QUALITY PROTEIN: BSD domain-containing protein 1 [Sarcophilus harrisii]